MKKSLLLAVAFVAAAAVSPAQTFTDVVIPQFIQGINGTNNNRTPYIYRATLSGLTANATYRFFNQVVVGTDAATASGAGNILFINLSGNNSATSTASLNTAGGFHTFQTDATGSFTGWFGTEPTSNARFTPGNSSFMRVSLNDGASGTAVATRLTSTASATVRNYGASGTDATFIRGRNTTGTLFTAKNVILLFDNVGGSGRPVGSSIVENDGLTYTAPSILAEYRSAVEGTPGAWGAAIGNGNTNGVRRIEERALSNGVFVSTHTDADGIWGSVDTTIANGATLEIGSVTNIADWSLID